MAQIQLADAVVVGIPNVEPTCDIEIGTDRIKEVRIRRGTAVTGKTVCAGSGYGRDLPRRSIDFAQTLIGSIRDVQIICRIDSEVVRIVELGAGGQAAIACIARRSRSSN